jgi:hypothetical protein
MVVGLCCWIDISIGWLVSLKPNNRPNDMVSDVSFRDLCLRPELIRAVNQAGFEHPSQGW